MDYFEGIKTNLLIDVADIEYNALSNKLDFNVNNIYKYVGYNEYNIDYSSSYLINKNKKKKQLNLVLTQENIDIIKCFHEYIIIRTKDNNTIVYKMENNIFTTFIKNIIDIFRINKIITCIMAYKNYDLYNLLKCKKRYNYFHEII